MNLFVFTGAGASAELGIPTMRPMAEKFLRHLNDIGWDPKDCRIPSEVLARNGSDMEHLIDEIDKLRNGFQSQRSLGLPCDEGLLTVLEATAREAEWFVQHLCEQIRPEEAEIVWTPFFRHLPDIKVSIVTSNYDRAIEIGARAAGAHVDDGFAESAHDEASRWVDFNPSAKITLMKVHGSTDWYQTADAKPLKLKHSIPIFGTLQLRLEGSTDQLLSAALVLPSREKKVTTPPYPQLNAAMYQHARVADGAVFVGTSLRDPHLKALFDECAARIPTAFVSRGDPPVNLGAAVHVRQSASFFLSSTLPSLLNGGGSLASRLTGAGSNAQRENVVPLIRSAWDTQTAERTRCDAIEALIRMRYSAHTSQILRLVSDASAPVRKFALGLVRDAYGDDDICAAAQNVALAKGDSDLESEVGLLKELLRPAA